MGWRRTGDNRGITSGDPVVRRGGESWQHQPLPAMNEWTEDRCGMTTCIFRFLKQTLLEKKYI